MRETVEEAARLLEQGEPCVMATVVRTKGSTPQKPGAQLLVRQDGSGIGTLGGGCVEGDIWYAAKEILRKGDGPEYKDYLLNEDIAARDGLVCGGSMYFFLEPLRGPEDFLTYAREMMEAYESWTPRQRCHQWSGLTRAAARWEPGCCSGMTAPQKAPWEMRN